MLPVVGSIGRPEDDTKLGAWKIDVLEEVAVDSRGMPIYESARIERAALVRATLSNPFTVQSSERVTKDRADHRGIWRCGEEDRDFLALSVKQGKTWKAFAWPEVVDNVTSLDPLSEYVAAKRPRRGQLLSLEDYCNKDSLLVIQVLCKGKPSDETILSVQQVLSDGRLVRIKGQTLYGSASGYLVQGFFLPAREAGFPTSLLINSELNRISCRAMKAEQENVQALARLKRGQTYTITGNVDIVARTGLDLVNCRFELE